METDRESVAYDALSGHARIADLAAIAHSLMASAVETRRSTRQPEWVASLASERHLTREEATTPFGNALDVLERGPEDGAERALACALAAHAIAHHPPKGKADEDRAAHDLVWLATHTAFDATGLVDRALGPLAAPLWTALAERIRRIDEGAIPTLGRGEALVAAIALAASSAPDAAQRATALAAELNDPRLARVLEGRDDAEPIEPVVGEVAPAPRGPVATTLLGITGILLVVRALQLVARTALSFRRPADVTLSPEGDVRVHWRVQILGTTLRERSVVLPRAGLVSASREVRFAGVAFYSGLLALAVGSYVGVSAFVDGVRAASPTLLGAGIAIAAAGIGLDFLLSCIAPATRGRCRVLFVLRNGDRICVGRVDVARADALLSRLTQ